MLLVLALAAPLIVARACPIAATSALPELVGTWEVRAVSGLDRPRPDTMRADATIAAELGDCLLRERLVARGGSPGYEALIHWGANGADSSIQRTFVHSNHGRFGVYQGRRTGGDIPLRQMPITGQSNATVVEHRVEIVGRDRFSISSWISYDAGGSWQALSRWEYTRKDA
jgi:hypothetical protein